MRTAALRLTNILEKPLTKEEIIAEWQLVEAARNDSARFSVLYERHYRQVWTFIFRRVEDNAVSSDLCQEVFLKTLLSLGKIRYMGLPFKAWLFRVASNEVNMHFRNRKYERVVSLERSDLGRLAFAANESKPVQDEEKMISLLKAEMESLDEKDLQLIEMRFFEKIPFSEVAFILGMTESNAKVRLHRILQRMGKRMRGKGGDRE